eukprot:Hpha_TRINITY_DN35486_c0_g1::TRINITY_DN35486_c0_g1_i1::g.83380::m.83380
MAGAPNKEERRPEDTDYKQQRLPIWTPLLTPHWVISCFVFTAAVCIPIGALILVAADSNKEVMIPYFKDFQDCHWSYGATNGGAACLYTPDQTECQGKCNSEAQCGMLASLPASCPRDFSSGRATSKGGSSKVDWTPTWQGNLTMLKGLGIDDDRRFGSVCDPRCSKNITFTVTETLTAPVYMYYRLTSFHQNHRLYAMSRRDKQLAGETLEGDPDCAPANGPGGLATSDSTWCEENFGGDCGSAKMVTCKPWATGSECQPSGGVAVSDMTYNPCGMVSWSMFNDSFAIYKPDNTLLCGGDAFSLKDSKCLNCGSCTKKEIAYPGDIAKKYKPPLTDDKTFTYMGFGKEKMDKCKDSGCNTWTSKEDASALPFLYHGWYFWEPYHRMPVTVDEDFMVWTRTQTLPTFRKLYRKIDVDMPPGTYTLQIDNRFDVSRFGGEKYVVLASLNWIGGENTLLGLLYIFAGMVSLGTAFVFAMMHMKQKKV